MGITENTGNGYGRDQEQWDGREQQNEYGREQGNGHSKEQGKLVQQKTGIVAITENGKSRKDRK